MRTSPSLVYRLKLLVQGKLARLVENSHVQNVVVISLNAVTPSQCMADCIVKWAIIREVSIVNPHVSRVVSNKYQGFVFNFNNSPAPAVLDIEWLLLIHTYFWCWKPQNLSLFAVWTISLNLSNYTILSQSINIEEKLCYRK